MTETPSPPPPAKKLPERNPLTHAAYRKQVFWQVTLPFVLVLLVFLGAVALVSWSAVGGSSQLRRWADVAIIWQSPLPIVLSMLCLVVNVGLLYGLIKLIGVVPGVARLLHNYVLLVQSKVNQVSDRLAAPFIKVDSLNSSAKAGWRALRRK